jgi:glyoxylase-like metal-dependent hydrolase (beta-lactamase superfamily II)
VSTLRALHDRVWTAEVPLREYDVRGVLVVGNRHAFVWDTLSRPRDMSGYLPLIGSLPLTIAYSHADWDHVWGTGGLPHRRAVVLGHRSCLARFGDDVPVTLREMRESEPGSWDDVQLVAPTQVLDEETTVDVEPFTVSIHHLPGHTPDCCVAFVPERGLLMMGDTAEMPVPVVPADAPLERWIAGLERWEGDLAVRTVVPAHGSIGGREILQRNLRYLKGLRDGRPVEPAGPLTEFYRRTHEANLRARG